MSKYFEIDSNDTTAKKYKIVSSEYEDDRKRVLLISPERGELFITQLRASLSVIEVAMLESKIEMEAEPKLDAEPE